MERREQRARRFDALFLDRDGTLISERNYLGDPAGVRLAHGAAERLKRFADRGTLLFVVTNQSGLARGILSWDDVRAVNGEVARRLAARGVPLAGVLVCPHYPGGVVPGLARRCRCRKPGTLLFTRALRRHGLVPGRVAVIGDKWDDVGAAVALGATPVHVLTGHGRDNRRRVRDGAPSAILARTLADALDRLLDLEGRPARRTRTA